MHQQTVIVTGAFGQLGRAVADHLESLGMSVGRLDFAPAPADAPPHWIGGTDLADEVAARSAFEKVAGVLGTPSALVNIAGGFVWETLAEGGPATWERMFRMNALTAATMCKIALPALTGQRGAAIVNIGAGAAARADAGMGAYAAAKSAVARLTESLAAELAAYDVTVNAVLPSIIDTPANRADMPGADFASWVRPHDIAKVIAFLLSAGARCITGASIPVSRGTGAG